MRPRLALLSLSIGLLVAAPASAQEALPDSVVALAAALEGDDPVPLDGAVFHDTLPNGLVLYVRENPEPRDRAELRLVIRVGSVLEEEDERGLAHLVEHMAFNGTERFEKQEIVDYLESIGMRFGPDVNAYTSFDETVYMLTVPTDSAARLETGLDILEEWAKAIAFDPAEVEKEIPVVVEEWRLRRGAGMRTLEEHLPVLLEGSRYAERLPIGQRETIESATDEKLRGFYERWYRPDLAAVIAVGDFDLEPMVEGFRERFGDWETPADAPARESWPVPLHEETRVSVATDPEAQAPDLTIYHKRPVRPMDTAEAYRRELVGRLRDRIIRERFGEIAQRADPPFVFGGSGSAPIVESIDFWVVQGLLKEDDVERGVEAIVREIERVDRHGFLDSELDRARAEAVRGAERLWDERGKTDSSFYAGRYAVHFLHGWPATGPALRLALHRRWIPGIELEEVDALTRSAIAEEARVVVLTAPEKEGVTVPAEDAILARFHAGATGEIAAWVDAAPEGPLVPDPPQPGRIEDERAIEAVGVTVWELSNGATVYLKPTDFKDDEVLLRATSTGGSSLVADSLVVPASTATFVVQQGGLGELDVVALQKALTGKNARVRPILGSLREGLWGFASPRDLETMFQLAWLSAMRPRADPDAFASARSRMEAMFANRVASPEAAWQDTLRVTLANHDPRLVLPGPGMIERMGLDASIEIYRDRFADFDDWTFFLVGAFDPDSVRPLVERWLASLPASERDETWRDVETDPPSGAVEKTVARGIEPKSLTEIVFHGPFEWSPENAHALGSLADYLRIRLREEMREEEGGTYFVRVSANPQRWPDEEMSLSISYGSDPGRAEELESILREEVEEVRAGEVDAEDFEKVRETQRRALETSLRENDWWADRLEDLVFHDLDVAAILDRENRIEGLEPEDIVEAARWIDPGRYVEVRLVPAEEDPAEEAGVPAN